MEKVENISSIWCLYLNKMFYQLAKVRLQLILIQHPTFILQSFLICADNDAKVREAKRNLTSG